MAPVLDGRASRNTTRAPASRARRSSSCSNRRPRPRQRKFSATQTIEQVGLAGARAEHAVAHEQEVDLGNNAVVTHAQAVAEDALRPRETIRSLLDALHVRAGRTRASAGSPPTAPRPGLPWRRSRRRPAAGCGRSGSAPAPQLVAHELQIVPGLALLARAAQQVGGVIGHDQRRAAPRRTRAPGRAACRSACRWPAGSAPRCAPPPASCAAGAARSAAAGMAGSRPLPPGWVAVARRPALEHVGDVHRVARRAHARAASN